MLNRSIAVGALVVALVTPSAAASQHRSLPATGSSQYAKGGSHYKPFPAMADSWYWEIDPPTAGLSGLPSTTGLYPAPGSAHVWDTDLFSDSNTSYGSNLGIPTGPSPVVKALHAAGHYSVCYVEAGAFQTGFPDDADFAKKDYGYGAKRYQMSGYPNEWWFDIAGFKNYVAGKASTLDQVAANIAGGLDDRFKWCALEGQNAVEPDDTDGYTNTSATGAQGGGWGLTQADSAGFERWLAYQAHADGLAVLQKNDPANANVDEPLFDGALSEECNYYADPCAGQGGDWGAYLAAGKPVFNAEYTQDGETTAKFCSADDHWGIWGALFSVGLSGPKSYKVCWNAHNML
ncbi:MAG: endo alpha-1,4 polygalactosaminidase [Acidimicrobiales bacterium]|jgi:hypothetical protein